MANKIYTLDTCTCSFIMREHPLTVLQKLQAEVAKQNQIVISAITYAEMRYGAIGKKASPKHSLWVDEFVQRLDDVLAWGVTAVDAATIVKKHTMTLGKLIGENDIAIAGHAISENCILVTNNTREFKRVENLKYEDWVH